MANQASDYHRGDMDIHEQAATYNLVMALTKWGSLTIGSLVLILVLWFCTSAGFVGALATGVVVAALGIFILRDGGSGH